ncbi:conserved membrane hypothetical protein [[Clostridium] ultunense Esp]|nr:conserved membrane hypothetical protein [[Clostridium] ultunense Esp]
MIGYLYPWLLFFHVFSVILSIGPYFILFPLLRRLQEASHEELEHHLFVFRYVVWISKHAGHLLVVTGGLLWWLGGYRWNTSWILIPIFILLSALFFLARAFSPTIKAIQEGKIDRREAVGKLRFSLYTYLVILLASLWFMIAKPTYW